jgi:tetratricopeptide (TPR) repeat protein
MRIPALLAAAALAAGSAAPAQAAVQIIGGGLGKSCYEIAKSMQNGGPAPDRAIEVCSNALSGEPLSMRDRAATLVNRGILYMSRKQYALALADHTRAAQIRPDLGAAYVNQGASLIALDRPSEGIAAIDKGLALNSQEPEKAYYNRAFARELMGDVKGAYVDFSKAAELKPNWELPRKELQRFTVSRPASQG